MFPSLLLTTAHVHAWVCLATMSNLSTLSQIAHGPSENAVYASTTGKQILLLQELRSDLRPSML